MTICCAILSEADGCWMGTDSLAVHGEHVDYLPRKHLERGGIAIAVAGAAIMLELAGDALGSVFEEARVEEPIPIVALTEELRRICNERGWSGKSDDMSPEQRDAELLITDGRRLFEVDSFFRPRPIAVGEFVGIGVCAYAYGAAFVAQQFGMVPHGVVRLAVEASTRFSIYAGGEPRFWLVRPAATWRFV